VFDLARPGSWSPPPAVMPHELTQKLLPEALYVASPTGISQLTEVLARRSITFTGDQLSLALTEAVRSGKAVVKQVPFGGEPVTLYALKGLGLG
jgi:hypothetical protein